MYTFHHIVLRDQVEANETGKLRSVSGRHEEILVGQSEGLGLLGRKIILKVSLEIGREGMDCFRIGNLGLLL
jgi:hypothetical protein